MKTKNGLLCTQCNTFLPEPVRWKDYNQCSCPNRAWIQRLPMDQQLWSYGSLNFHAHERIKNNGKAQETDSRRRL